jgi:hypothetical protein
MNTLSNATSTAPQPALELRPAATPAVRRAKRWGRRVFSLALIAIVAGVGYRFAIHTIAALRLSALGGQIQWEGPNAGAWNRKYGTAGSGTILNVSGTYRLLANRHLAWLPWLYRLKVVDLSRCGEITDDGVEFLAPLIGLTELHLSRKQDQGWNPEDEARLVGPRLTDRGLLQLSRLTQLQILSLEGTEITDAGLSALHEMTNLKVLDLSGTTITDAGLKALKHLTNLRYLRLDETGVTCAGKDALALALPDTVIEFAKCEPDTSNQKTTTDGR